MKFFKTTYQNIDDDEILSHAQYQLDFLNVFELNSYDDNKISNDINNFTKELMERKDYDEKYKMVFELVNNEKTKHNFLPFNDNYNLDNNDNILNTTNNNICDYIILLFAWDNLHILCDIMSS